MLPSAIPSVRNIQAAIVQGRDQRAHAASSLPDASAAIDSAKATEKPTYPMYSIGGWKISPGSCSSGFRSRPSAGTRASRSNGFDVNRMNAWNAAATSPSTPSVRATSASGSERDASATASVQPASIRIHSSSEPSWPPPYRGQPVGQRQLGVRVLGDVGEREIVLRERPAERAEGERDEQELRRGGRARERHPACIAACRADQRQHAQRERHAKRERQREVAELGDHLPFTTVFPALAACSSACAASGGI
jgi:hypothetical protein